MGMPGGYGISAFAAVRPESRSIGTDSTSPVTIFSKARRGVSLGAGRALKAAMQEFLAQRAKQLVFRKLLDDFTALKKQSLTNSSGNAKVCFFGFAGAVNYTAHNSNLDAIQ